MISSKNRGFTLLEFLITLAIVLTMAGFTFLALMPLLNQSHVDAAYDTTLSAIRGYRNQAITGSQRYILTFTAPGTITVQYWGVAVPVSPAPVTVATFTLPADMQFAVQPGFPNPGPDSLDAGTAPVSFNACTVVASGSPCLIFYPDGSAQDDLGQFNNGVVYMTRTGDMYSSRAVSVFGTTGRTRGWRMDPNTNNWTQQ